MTHRTNDIECYLCSKENIDYSEIDPVFIGRDSGYQKLEDCVWCDLHGIVRTE